jgi:hypothetical protein
VQLGFSGKHPLGLHAADFSFRPISTVRLLGPPDLFDLSAAMPLCDRLGDEAAASAATADERLATQWKRQLASLVGDCLVALAQVANGRRRDERCHVPVGVIWR